MPITNLEMYSAIAGVLFVALVVVLFLKNKENFDVNTDPVRTGYKQNIHDCPTPLEARGSGLNVQGGGAGFTVCDFIEKFKDKLPISKDIDREVSLDIIPRQYCALMYENFQEDFHDRWESLGVCEQLVKEQVEKCPMI